MKRYNELKRKSITYIIYHDTYSEAVGEALRYVEESLGYTYDADDVFNMVGLGPKKSSGYTYDLDDVSNMIGLGPKKPSVGKTNSFHIPLMDKKFNPVKKVLHFQVYNTGKKFELNAYVS